MTDTQIDGMEENQEATVNQEETVNPTESLDVETVDAAQNEPLPKSPHVQFESPSSPAGSHSSSLEMDDCPPTPEHVPPGSTTPPPSSTQSNREFTKNRGKRRSRSLDGRSSPDSDVTCPICLGEVDNKSMTDTCLHKFCFTCLLEWSKVKAVCPLCKGKFTSILHNIRSDDDYDKYTLPPPEPQQDASLQDFLYSTRRFRYHTTMTNDRLERRRDFLNAQVARMNDTNNLVLPAQPYRELNSRQIWRRRRGPGTSDFRRDVYTTDLWAQPLSDITNRFRDCSPEWYRTNEAQTHRLIPWLNRELNVLLEISGQQGRQEQMISQILEWVKLYNITSPEMRDQLLPYLGTSTEHFQHEFYNFARSPFDLTGYDRNVTYANRRVTTEVVSSDSDSSDNTVENLGNNLDGLNNSVQYIEEIRNRVQESHENLNRMLAERMAVNPALNLGVTNYPDRSGREGREGRGRDRPRSSSDDRRGRGREEERSEERLGSASSFAAWRREVERSRERGSRRDDSHRGYRREMDRFWGIRNRLVEDRDEGNRRRKNRKPSRYQRGRIDLSREISVDGEDDDSVEPGEGGGEAEAPIDLSVSREEVVEEQPSTSRGHSSGLTRLVIPDSDSEVEDAGQNLIIDDVTDDATENLESNEPTTAQELVDAIEEASSPEATALDKPKSSLRPDEVGSVREKIKDMVSSVLVPAEVTPSSGGVAPCPPVPLLTSGYIPLATPGYYTDHYASQNYSAGSQFAFLSELTGMLHAGAALATPPPLEGVDMTAKAYDMTANKLNDDEDNSDLEVIDVIKAKTRKVTTKDPEVVELSDSDNSDTERSHAIDAELARQSNPTYLPPPVFDPDEPVVISSDDDDEGTSRAADHNYMDVYQRSNHVLGNIRMRLNTLEGGGGSKKGKKFNPPPPADSSSDDDLIVVKTEHNTIDPITKKQIVEPVRNKKCNHIYEKSTIYSMIELARENSKSVKCPYMGCNCKDFKKTDLVKDKEVLGHINKVREEKEKADIEKREVEKKAREEKRKRREEGNDSDRSADSIVEEVIEMIKEKSDKEVPPRKEPNLSESSSDLTTSDDSTSKSTSSSNTSSEAPTSKTSVESELNQSSTTNDTPVTVEPEKSKTNETTERGPRGGKKSSKRRRVLSNSESEDSDSDMPLSRARAKRSRKQPRKLDDSFSGCEFDEAHSDLDDNTSVKRVRKNGKKPSKKIKIVGKKVTETWCIEKADKLPKKRRAKEKWTNVVPNEDFETDEDVPVSRKGKSSRNKPPKNGNKDGIRPKRAQKVSYAESDDEF